MSSWYDPTSTGLSGQADDDWYNLYFEQGAIGDTFGKWATGSGANVGGVIDTAFGAYARHTNCQCEQWRDPSKTTMTWPDPPLAQRSWSFDAWLGVHDADNFSLQTSRRWNETEDAQISHFATVEGAASPGDNVPAGDVTGVTLNGTIMATTDAPPVQEGIVVGRVVDSKVGYANSNYGPSHAYIKPPGIYPDGTIYGLSHEIVGSARHIYEPSFVSTPYNDSLTFIREGIETTRVTHTRGSQPTYRMIYTNERAEKRDFGVSQTQKVPTGGIGGNPFWLKDTKDWPDILKSLHFDFMPFMVPQAKTRPVNYRFWDSMYATALFGGPTFAIVLDNYGMFDEEYYRMVVRHFTQSEQQITQWRAGIWPDSSKIDDRTALCPRNYINPHAWYQAMSTGKVAPNHPFKDTTAGDFAGGSFSMEGWTGPCCELVLGFPPDNDVNGTPLVNPRYGNDMSLMRSIYPYYDSKQELTMNNKRKLHQHNCHVAHPFAVQDYYYTFVLAAESSLAYGQGMDIFEYSKDFAPIEHLTPEMLTHMLVGSPADIPFTLGHRFKDLLRLAGDSNATSAMLGECFDDTVMTDPLIPKLHDPIVGVVQAYVVENLQKLQKWAIKEVVTVVKAQGAKITEKYVWPLIEAVFPKLAPFIKSNLKELGSTLTTIDFTKPTSTWGPQLISKMEEWFKGVATNLKGAGTKWLKDGGQDMLMRSLRNRFRSRPDTGLTEEELENWGVDDDGWRFPDSKFDEEMSMDDSMKVRFNELESKPETWIGEDVGEATEAVEAGAEASMASIAGPLILAVAITLVLDWWEKKEEDDAKAAQEAAQARATWEEYDTLRVPFNVTYLTGLGPRINKFAGYGSSGDSVADSQGLLQGLYGAGGNVPKDLIAQEIKDQVDQTADSGGNYSASKGQRFINLDPTLVDKNKRPVPVAGDLRTVANLIAMNHLCLKVINPGFFANSENVTDAITLRAQQLLICAEIIRTMRVVDHFMRAASWTEWVKAGLTANTPPGRPTEDAWHPYPPTPNIPTSLIPAYMTPIPVFVPTKTDMPDWWWESLQSVSGGNKKGKELFQLVEGTGAPASEWDGFAEQIANWYGGCPMYEFNDVTYVQKDTGISRTVRTRAVPVPIFAPGRSPTMFVSSLDPTFAWPTLAVRGGPMSNFNDETKYFEQYNICYQPHPSSSDLMNIKDWRNAIKDVSCTPTFGGKRCRFILTVDTTPLFAVPDGKLVQTFRVVNESHATVVVVYVVDDGSVYPMITLKPGETGDVFKVGDFSVQRMAPVAAFYILSQEFFADQTNALRDFTDDMMATLPYTYRSYMFTTNLIATPMGGAASDFLGTITVFDHTLISTNIYNFESRMNKLVAPIMSKNPHCYEPLSEFWNTYYPKLSSVEFKKHDAVCSFLLSYILPPEKDDFGTPVATPLDKEKQINIWSLGRTVFHGDKETWTKLYNMTPSPDDLKRFPGASCTELNSTLHPKTYPEGGLRVHRLLSYTDDPASAARTASYSYDAEEQAILTSYPQMRNALEAIRSDPVKIWGSGDEFFDAVVSLTNDIINNNQDVYDAAQIVHKLYGESADALDAFGAAETIRTNRISAILRLTADIDNSRAETAIEEYKQRTSEPSSLTRALEMIFTVRKNPAFREVNNTYFSTYPALHQLLMQMAKDCYNTDLRNRTNLTHPSTKQIAYYLTTGELASTMEASIYFMPQLTDPAISGPTLFVAFRGTDPDKDLINKFGKTSGFSLFQKIATFLNPYSDLMSDLHILLGTQAEAPRFDASDALITTAGKYKMNLVLTGHSLGGSLAVHCLERNPNVVTMAVVFNPGKGLDGSYFDQVEDNIANNVKATTIITDTEADSIPDTLGGQPQWIVPADFNADADLNKRNIQGTVVPDSVRVDMSQGPYVAYDWVPRKAAMPTETYTMRATVSPTTLMTDTEADPVDWGDGEAHYQVPTDFNADADLQSRNMKGAIVVPGSVRADTEYVQYDYYSLDNFSAEDDFKTRGVTGTVVPNSTRWGQPPTVLYDYTAIKTTTKTIETNVLATWIPDAEDGQWDIPATFDADADFKTRGIAGTVVPNSTRLDMNAEAEAPLVIYDYTTTSDRPVWNWFDKLTTYRVSGTSSWPIDDDPVSVLSGGLGTTFEYVGPGVPTRLKAHSSDNWDTTAVGRDRGVPIYPPKS
jgi:pimeloyl-ACP methyl ester carboxylesterase